MTITPPRAAGGTSTRSARGRNRRRQNAAGEPRHAAVNQTEQAPPLRRRGGRHAADDPVPSTDLAGGLVTGSADVGFPAPSRDPWATGAAPASLADPVEASGVVDARAFRAGPDGRPTAAGGWPDPAGTGWPDSAGTGWLDGPGAGFFADPLTDDGESPDRAPAAERDGAGAGPLPVPAGAEPVDHDASGDDEGARGAYRMRKRRRLHARRPRNTHLGAALARCGLYLGPLSVAIAAAESLGRVAWPVPAVMMLLGWTAAQGLTGAGVAIARRAGQAAAARTVGAGFAAVIGLWCALVWVAPDALLGPDRLLALTLGIGGLTTLASVTAALVTRAESAVAGWYVPCWLLAAAVIADAAGVAGVVPVPVVTLLPAAIVAVAVRAFRPAVLPAVLPSVLSAPVGRGPRLTPADRRRALAYLVIGAAQAVAVTQLWQSGPAFMPLAATLPLLLAVPLLEGLIGWHTDRLGAALDSAETPEEFDRHVRNVTAITLAGLVPPLAVGCGLLIAAFRLPYGFSAVPTARDAVLALAAGTLLGGVFAVTFLLAARSRHGIAATLAVIPPLAAAVLALFAPPAGLMPAAVAVLAATHLTGLLIVALTAADLRRTP